MQNNPTLNARQRKALLLLPVLIIPFLTMAFWALGGGKGRAKVGDSTTAGLNLNLPPAQLKDDKNETKMSFYDAAQREAALRGDSVSRQPVVQAGDSGQPVDRDYPFAAPPPSTANQAPVETKIYQKLAELNGQLAATTTQPAGSSTPMPATGKSHNAAENRHLEQLETLLRAPATNPADPDPELENLNGMMDKILDIQHPERVRERLQNRGNKQSREGLSVTTDRSDDYCSLLGASSSATADAGFWGTDEVDHAAGDGRTIAAVVHGTQSLVDGSLIKLRLLQDLYVGGQPVLKGAFVFGTLTLHDERGEINISAVQYGGTVLPVSLEVYDMDGLPGIYIPGVVAREAVKTSTDGAVQSLDIGMLDPSLKAQAASAGLSTVKNLLGKKTRQVRITVKAGYRVLLQNKKASTN